MDRSHAHGSAAAMVLATVVLAVTGCTARAASSVAGPTAPPSSSRVAPASCPAIPPDAGMATVAGTGPLVTTSPEPVALTLCIYRPHAGPYENGRPAVSWSPPSSVVQSGRALQKTVAQLNALRPPPTDVVNACNLMLGPEYRLLLAYAGGHAEELTVTVNCDVVANQHGVVRVGIVPVIRELDPA